MILPDPSDPRQRLPSATLWRMGLASVAGFWLARRIPLSVVVAAAGAWLLTRQQRSWSRPRRILAPDTAPHDGPWPEAPETEPFVPHTRAWDELREAISPVLHAPAADSAPAPAKGDAPDHALPQVESFAFEATEPFIIEDDDADAPKR